VVRQTVHDWLRSYATGGLAALADGSSRPQSCPHQMAPEVEAAIVGLRGAHPGWGPRTIGHRLRRDGVEPVPGRSSIYRCLVRHGLIDPQARRKRRSDYKRWERSRAMELWQMDIVGGVILAGGGEAKIVTGVDDHSRFCVSAYVVPRATARPTCDALALAMRTHGVPDQVLTDNGKVFTGRFGPGTGEGPLRPHLERERHPPPIGDAQAALDAWLTTTTTSGTTRASAWWRRSSASVWPPPSRSRPTLRRRRQATWR
jgi:hypothetical protein